MSGSSAAIFTTDAMTLPLFEEPTEDIQREHPFSGPQGFMFGGMSQPTAAELAEEYFEAGDLILEAVKRGDIEDYKIANAALFLFRHGAELILKGGLGRFPKTHDLSDLADDFAAFVKREHNEDVPDWIVQRLKELASIDNRGATAFRYGEYRDPLDKANPPLYDEVHVRLPRLQAAMKALRIALVLAVARISERRIARLVAKRQG